MLPVVISLPGVDARLHTADRTQTICNTLYARTRNYIVHTRSYRLGSNHEHVDYRKMMMLDLNEHSEQGFSLRQNIKYTDLVEFEGHLHGTSGRA